MAAKASSSMHDRFPLWYRAVHIGDDPQRIERRWAGVAALVEDATPKVIEPLVRLAFKSRHAPTPEALTMISAAFKEGDQGFELQDNARELEVLCGASLAILFERRSPAAAAAALAVTTTAMAGARKPNLPMDLVALAESALPAISESMRRRPNLLEYGSSGVPKLDLENVAAKLQESGLSPASVAEAISAAAEAMRSALAVVAKRHARVVHAADTFLKAQDEELQMLWWLIGQQSWDFNRRFNALPADVQPLILAKELADMTVLSPGPPSVAALLSRAGLKGRKAIAIASAINEADSQWLTRIAKDKVVSPLTQPLHFAIQRQLETGAGSAWVAGWAAAAGLSPDAALSPLSLGTQFYRERLLVLSNNQ